MAAADAAAILPAGTGSSFGPAVRDIVPHPPQSESPGLSHWKHFAPFAAEKTNTRNQASSAGTMHVALAPANPRKRIRYRRHPMREPSPSGRGQGVEIGFARSDGGFKSQLPGHRAHRVH